MNTFKKDLQYSLKAKVLDQYYKSRGFKYIQNVTDLETQKKGIDKILYYGKGKTVTVDEKKRRSSYDDFLVETMKNVEQNKKGWLYYTQAKYIIYWIEPLEKFYIIVTKELQDQVFKNNWINTKPTKTTYINKYYTTENIVLQWSDLDNVKCVSYKNGEFEVL